MPTTKQKNKSSLADFRNAVTFSIGDAWKHNRTWFILTAFAAMASAIFPYIVNGFQALLLNTLVHSATVSSAGKTINVLLIGLGIIFLVRDDLGLAYAYFDRLLYFRGAKLRQVEFSAQMLALDQATHEDPTFQDELQVLNEYSSTYVIPNLLDAVISNAQNVIGFTTAAIIVLAIDWKLFFLIVVFSVPRLYTELRYGRQMWGFFHSQSEERRRFYEYNRHVSSDNIAELQTFQSEQFFLKRMGTMLEAWFNGQIVEERKKLLLAVGTQLLATSSIIIAFAILVHQAQHGALQVGTLIFALTSMVGLQGSVSGFFLGIGTISRSARPANAYQKIIARKRQVPLPMNPVRHAFTSAPRIEFKDVSFAYPTTPDRIILQAFSLVIEPGERIAIIGINGAGKSTLIKLLCRFYDPTSGQILVNGIDLRTIDLNDWYSALALLSQDFNNYRFKVDESIALGRSSVESDQVLIKDASRRAEADEFIMKWEQGYDAQIGTEFGGIDPSGGQRQKLALARTLYRNAFVTILDEPTAHVDAMAEQQIFERLYQQLNRNQTLIIISHRFSTIRNADRVCVIEDGKVSELGSHDQLMELNGRYATLFTSQAEQYR